MMTSIVSHACQSWAQCCKPAAEQRTGSLWELTDFNFPHIKMAGLLVQMLCFWGGMRVHFAFKTVP